MKLFDVYSRFDVHLKKANGVYVYDENENPYLDCYGGHGVISIGHNHPHWKTRIQEQMENISFYSNSVKLDIQDEFAEKLGAVSGYSDYNLFLCNSGSEANENALKLASFHTGKKKVIAFKNSFHGRTSASLNVTSNPSLSSALNKQNFPVCFLQLNDAYMVKEVLKKGDVAAIIVEGIQGVGGLDEPTEYFLEKLSQLSKEFGAVLILDEIQSGYGRTGKFFAHQHSGIKPDIITMAKGMGNGFPIAGLLISPEIKAISGQLGTTFGGNPLACAAGLAVLEILEKENLIENASNLGEVFLNEFSKLNGIKKIKGKGLMMGIEFEYPISGLRKELLYDFKIFTGSSANPKQIRILPPLSIKDYELGSLKSALKQIEYEEVY